VSPTPTIRCRAYSATLTAASCVARQARARRDNDPAVTCRSCPDGEATAASLGEALPRLTPLRYRNQATSPRGGGGGERRASGRRECDGCVDRAQARRRVAERKCAGVA
jgi:hypothetical protein